MPTISDGTSSSVAGVEGAVSRAAVCVSVVAELSVAAVESVTAAVWVLGAAGLRLGTGGRSSALVEAGAAATCCGAVAEVWGVEELQPTSTPTRLAMSRGEPSRLASRFGAVPKLSVRS
jgi:hypothetical protein